MNIIDIPAKQKPKVDWPTLAKEISSLPAGKAIEVPVLPDRTVESMRNLVRGNLIRHLANGIRSSIVDGHLFVWENREHGDEHDAGSI